MYNSQIAAAEREGYSADDIVGFLAQRDPRVQTARSEGHSADDILAFLKGQPEASAPRTASQADVRRVDQEIEKRPQGASDDYRWSGDVADANAGLTEDRLQKRFDDAMKEWRRATGGVLKPGQNVRRATEEWSGVPDPQRGYNERQLERVRETGEIEYGDTVPYELARLTGNVGGFMVAGPAGATAADAAVRLSSLVYNARNAVNAGALDEDAAAGIIAKEMAKGVSIDAALNFGLPVLGRVIAKIPGVEWLLGKVGTALKTMAEDPGQRLIQQSMNEFGHSGSMREAGRIDPLRDFGKIPTVEPLPGTPWAEESQLDRVIADRARAGAASRAQEDALRVRAAGLAGYPGSEQSAAAMAAERARIARDNDIERKAIEGLVQRTPTRQTVPSPSKVTGETDWSEQVARTMSPHQFEAADEALGGAAEQMRRELFRERPMYNEAGEALPITGKETGQRVLDALDAIRKRTKAAWRTTFDDAAEAGVTVDMRPVRAQVRGVLERDAASQGRLLSTNERAEMERLLGKLSGNPTATAEGALDFISGNKATLRDVTRPDRPGEFYSQVLGDLNKTADTWYTKALEQSGKGDIVGRLAEARNAYREMNDLLYRSDMRSMLRRNPEDVAGAIWKTGNVTEVEQAHRAIEKAVSQGALSSVEGQAVKADLLSTFLAKNIGNVEAAASWSQTLASKPELRRTFDALSRGADAEGLETGMRVLERAAQIASRKGDILPGAGLFRLFGSIGIPGAGLVFGNIMGGVKGVAVALNIKGAARMMATAYTQGNAGVVRSMARLLALSNKSALTGAEVELARKAANEVDAFAKQNNIDLFQEMQNAGEAAYDKAGDAWNWTAGAVRGRNPDQPQQ